MKPDKENEIFMLAKNSSIGYYVVAPLLLGVFIGFGLDKYFSSKPLFTIVFLLIGVVATFYNLRKLIKESQ